MARLIKWHNCDRRHMSLMRGKETLAQAFLRKMLPPGAKIVTDKQAGEQYRVRCGGGGSRFWDPTDRLQKLVYLITTLDGAGAPLLPPPLPPSPPKSPYPIPPEAMPTSLL